MILHGKKITLRPLRQSDAARYLKWFADPAVTRFLQTRDLTMKDERAWISEARKQKPQLVFAIETKAGKHIGSVGFNSWKPKDRCVTFGIFIGETNEWRKGYGEEATRLILKYGFKVLHLHRIELKVFASNKNAKRLYKKLGFKHEGTMRDARYFGAGFEDLEVWGILESRSKN